MSAHFSIGSLLYFLVVFKQKNVLMNVNTNTEISLMPFHTHTHTQKYREYIGMFA